MAARRVTYADLDALLRRLGMAARRVEVPLQVAGAEENGRGIDSAVPNSLLPARVAIAYEDADTDTVIIIPERPPSEPVQPQHLIPTRRHLIEKGLIDEDDFERWQCQIRFGPERREPTGAVAGEERGMSPG